MQKLYDGGFLSDGYLKMQEMMKKEDEVISLDFSRSIVSFSAAFLQEEKLQAHATSIERKTEI